MANPWNESWDGDDRETSTYLPYIDDEMVLDKYKTNGYLPLGRICKEVIDYLEDCKRISLHSDDSYYCDYAYESPIKLSPSHTSIVNDDEWIDEDNSEDNIETSDECNSNSNTEDNDLDTTELNPSNDNSKYMYI